MGVKKKKRRKEKGKKEGRRVRGKGKKPVSIFHVSCLENTVTVDGFLSNHP